MVWKNLKFHALQCITSSWGIKTPTMIYTVTSCQTNKNCIGNKKDLTVFKNSSKFWLFVIYPFRGLSDCITVPLYNSIFLTSIFQRFERLYNGTQQADSAEKKQLVSLHMQHRQAELNSRKRKELEAYMMELQKTPVVVCIGCSPSWSQQNV